MSPTTHRTLLGGSLTVGAAALVTPAEALEAVTDQAAASPKDKILAVNVGMRKEYAALKAELVKHLTPVIVVQNDARGDGSHW